MKWTICLAIIASLVAITAGPAIPATGLRDRGTSPIEGLWTTPRATLQELVAAGMTHKDAATLTQHGAKKPGLELRAGVFTGFDLATNKVVATGTYRLAGNLIWFVFKSGLAVQHGFPFELTWSVYGDRLTFSRVPSRPSLIFTIRPWTRVR
jgi:hypothetical protein